MMWMVVLIVFVLLYQLLMWFLTSLRVGDYANKYVLVSGCDSGFGKLLVKRLDNIGFRVIATCLTRAGMTSLQAECSRRITVCLMDVTDSESITVARQHVEEILPDGLGLWGLVNNAGVMGAPLPIECLNKKHWTTCLSVNLIGTVEVTKAFLPFVRMARGRVVNVASVMGRIAAAHSPYSVSKFGVEAFSDCLRRETYNQGVKVSVIEPGFFKTEMISFSHVLDDLEECQVVVPQHVRQLYPLLDKEKFFRMTKKVQRMASKHIHLPVDAMVHALTSRFPPTRQLVGNDARFFFRLLWNIPTPIADWILIKMQKNYEH